MLFLLLKTAHRQKKGETATLAAPSIYFLMDSYDLQVSTFYHSLTGRTIYTELKESAKEAVPVNQVVRTGEFISEKLPLPYIRLSRNSDAAQDCGAASISIFDVYARNHS